MAKIKFYLFSRINFSWAFLPLFFYSQFAMADPPVAGITAHRGNSGEYPENTIPAFESAIALGLDWAELDVHLTKDGKLAVIHDNNTARVGDKALDIATSTYEELLTVDVAAGFRKAKGKTIQDCPPQSTPLLEDVLAVFLKQSQTKLSIQPKANIITEAIKIIEQMGAQHVVGFNDGNLEYMSKVKELAPQIPVFWDRPAHSEIDQDISVAKEKGFEALIVNYKGIDREKIQKIKAAGLEAGAWTVNERQSIEELLLMGVERIYTDVPRLMMAIRPVPDTIVCEGIYEGHLQGITIDEGNHIYWSWTDKLVKTDMEGKIIQTLKVPSHHGDLCYKDGKIYVAVNLGKFNRPEGQADSWVFIYDAITLKELQRQAVPEVVYGAGGITFYNGKFIVVGGLVPGSNENYLYEYAEDFTFLQRHILASGYTLMGIQTITYDDGHFWYGCYGDPEVLLQSDVDFQVTGKRNFDASLGIAGFSKGEMLIGSNVHLKDKGYIGRAVKVKKTLF